MIIDRDNNFSFTNLWLHGGRYGEAMRDRASGGQCSFGLKVTKSDKGKVQCVKKNNWNTLLYIPARANKPKFAQALSLFE